MASRHEQIKDSLINACCSTHKLYLLVIRREKKMLTPFSSNGAKLTDDKSSPSKVFDVNQTRMTTLSIGYKTTGLKDYKRERQRTT